MKTFIKKNTNKRSAISSQANRLYYLEFIRNLTPQAFILAIAFVLGSKFTFSLDFDNTIPTIFFGALLWMWGYAAYANISLYLERTLENRAKERATRLLRQLSYNNRSFLKLQATYMYRTQKIYTLRVYVGLGTAEIGFTVSVLYALQAAETLLKVLSH